MAESDLLLELQAAAAAEELRCAVNREQLPGGLRYMAAEIAAGRWLEWMRDAGLLSDVVDGLDFAVAEIHEGDTAVVYAADTDQTAAARLDRLIACLTRDRSSRLRRYRALQW